MAAFLSTTTGVVVLVVLVGLSAFFSSSETAIFTLPDAWVDDQAKGSDSRGRTLHELRSDPHRLLVTILVGNNIVNMAIASITTALLIERLPTGSAVTVATVVASCAVLVFGEIVPKSYGLGNARRWALRVARPVRLAELTLFPLVVFFDAITRALNKRLGGDADIEQPYVEE